MAPTTQSEDRLPSIRRRSLITADQLEARELLDEVFGGLRLRLRGGRAGRLDVSLTEVAAGKLTVCETQIAGDVTFRVDRGDVIVSTVLAGGVDGKDGFGERYGPGEVFVGRRPEMRAADIRNVELHVHTVGIPEEAFLGVTGEETGRRSPIRRLTNRADPDGAKLWQQVTHFVDGLLSAESEAAGAPLVLGQVERLLAASALACLGGQVVDEPAPREGRDAHPETLRRAIAFIEANPHRDISVVDIARASYATPRTVQMAFRRHLDTTPIAYLRQVRLAHAHEALESAARADGNTVARIALEWGFANPSRFAAYYREAYGRAPGKTLAG